MTVEELCQEIQAKRNAKYAVGIGPWPKNNMTASDISECRRESVFGITNWRDRPAVSVDLAERFKRGNTIEDLIVLELMELGFHVRVDRAPFEIRDKEGRLICRGKVDGFLTPPEERKEVPFECKSLNPNVYARIDTQEDFDRYHFAKKYPKQLQSYMYANNFEAGFWILDDCMGHWKFLPCRLDYQRMEGILQHLESVAEHLAKRTQPDFHKDPATCLKCWCYGRLCSPPFFAQSEGLKLLEDPEVASKLQRRSELAAARKEYEDLDSELKELLKGRDNLIIGDFLIRGQERTRKTKATEAKETKYWQTTIEPLKEDEHGGEN